MSLVSLKDGEYIAVCDFDFKVNKDGDFDGDWDNNILKQFKKGDKLKQSIAVRLLLRNPELVAKSDGKEPMFEEVKAVLAERKPTIKELESDWLGKNKATQTRELIRLGLSEVEIKKLSESQRVKKIAELSVNG